MVDLTKRYIDSLGPRETIMVPSVVLAEYLSGFDDAKKRERQLAILRKRFYIPSFNIPAAALAAELAKTPEVSGVIETVGRVKVKADLQIIATALIHSADAIITANIDEFQRLAAGRIKIMNVPEVHVQLPLHEGLPT
jgi:predicted nucleic acid-binding protein